MDLIAHINLNAPLPVQSFEEYMRINKTTQVSRESNSIPLKKKVGRNVLIA